MVALLLSKLVTWMRKQTRHHRPAGHALHGRGGGLRAADGQPAHQEADHALMKQARAFGVGVVLATQNPVDLDYKAISNAGTWMVGRLQTDRDKARLLDGMSAAAGGVDVGAVGDTISGLGKREFVLRRAGKDTARGVHHALGDELPARPADPRPDRPPDDRRRDARGAAPPAPPTAAPARHPPPAPAAAAPPPRRPRRRRRRRPPVARHRLADDETPIVPEVAAGTAVRWLDAASSWALQVGAVPDATRWEAGRRRPGAPPLRRHQGRPRRRRGVGGGAVPARRRRPTPAAAVAVDYDDRDLLPRRPRRPLRPAARAGQGQAVLDAAPARPRRPPRAQPHDGGPDQPRRSSCTPAPARPPASFAARCTEAADAKADDAQAALQTSTRPRPRRMQSQMATAEGRADVLEAEARSRQQEEVVSTAGSLLGAFLGGRRSAPVDGVGARRGHQPARSHLHQRRPARRRPGQARRPGRRPRRPRRRTGRRPRGDRPASGRRRRPRSTPSPSPSRRPTSGGGAQPRLGAGRQHVEREAPGRLTVPTGPTRRRPCPRRARRPGEG